MKKNVKKSEKKSDPSISLEEWMNKPSTKRLGKKCETCEYGPDFREHIRTFMKHRIAGKTRKRSSELCSWLQENFEYALSTNSLCRHMRACESDLYVEMRKSDIKYKMALGPSQIDGVLGRWESK